jgi:hypothetical protein
MNRSTIAVRCLMLASMLTVVCTTTHAAEPKPITGGGVTGLDLKTQLEKGLKARRPVEFEYIAQINSMVEDGSLPRSLVTSTFGWARHKPTRQLQYFQFALQARAKNLNVKLPDLRKQAVGINTNGGENGFGNFGHDPTGTGP